jgi:hypothetical protein
MFLFDGDAIAMKLEIQKSKETPGSWRYIKLEMKILAAKNAAAILRVLYGVMPPKF